MGRDDSGLDDEERRAVIALLCSLASLFAVIAYVLFLVAWRAWDENRVLREELDIAKQAFERRDKQYKEAMGIIDHCRGDVFDAIKRAAHSQSNLDKGR